jgi:hypothetical protein
MITDKELLDALDKAEKRIMKKIKKRMIDLSKDEALREEMEEEIHKCLTGSTRKVSVKKGRKSMKPKISA